MSASALAELQRARKRSAYESDDAGPSNARRQSNGGAASRVKEEEEDLEDLQDSDMEEDPEEYVVGTSMAGLQLAGVG